MEPSESSPPFSSSDFATGTPHVKSIEICYALGCRLYGAAQGERVGFLIQQAYMAFAKTLMSVEAYLRFVPSSAFYVRKQAQLGDVSSASTLARQVLDDAISFLYLSDRNLTPEEEEFRRRVWLHHAATEYVESLEVQNPSHPDLSTRRAERDTARRLVQQSALLKAVERGRRGRIRNGQEGQVLHPDQILERRAIKDKHYDLPRKILSNFAHFSGFSYIMMQAPINELAFFVSLLCVARFFAEALEVFSQTFPHTRRLICKRQQTMIARLRAELRKDPS